MAHYWHYTIPQLQKLLDKWDEPYPAKGWFVNEEKYRVELIKLVIDKEPRIA